MAFKMNEGVVMAGDEEVEAVARALDHFANRSRQGNPAALAHWRKAAEVALAAADRVRSRPASGTGISNEDAKALDALADHPKPGKIGGTEGENHRTAVTERDGVRCECGWWGSMGDWRVHATAPSPVSGTEPDTAAEAVGIKNCADRTVDRPWFCAAEWYERRAATEPDTAKLVEAARWYVECRERYFRREPVSGLDEAWEGLRSALAGFSVDAGKPEEER